MKPQSVLDRTSALNIFIPMFSSSSIKIHKFFLFIFFTFLDSQYRLYATASGTAIFEVKFLLLASFFDPLNLWPLPNNHEKERMTIHLFLFLIILYRLTFYQYLLMMGSPSVRHALLSGRCGDDLYLSVNMQ